MDGIIIFGLEPLNDEGIIFLSVGMTGTKALLAPKN
jgi:hypothetical protein